MGSAGDWRAWDQGSLVSLGRDGSLGSKRSLDSEGSLRCVMSEEGLGSLKYGILGERAGR